MNTYDIVQKRNHYLEHEQPDMYKKFYAEQYSIALLQLRDDLPERHYIRFEKYERVLQELGKEPTADMYDIMYAEKYDPAVYMDNKERICNYIYEKFNLSSRPNIADGYYGTSASVSDVILIKQNDIVSAMYIDDVGFKEIYDFSLSSVGMKRHNIQKRRDDFER